LTAGHESKEKVPQLAKTSQPEFLVIGRILAPYGAKGEVKVKVLTDFPERFDPQEVVYIEGTPTAIESSHHQKGNVEVKLAGVDSIEAAQGLCGKLLEIHRHQAKSLPQGEYYHFQLVGLEVWTTQGELLGKVATVLETGSNDVYLVQGPRGEILIPAVEDVVKSIDLTKGCMVVEAVKGIL
jgi:16S rRNA processing protein RimM